MTFVYSFLHSRLSFHCAILILFSISINYFSYANNKDCLCQFATGCTTDAGCCSGLYCQLGNSVGASQCLEVAPTSANCITTNNYGCTTNSDCCNPAAKCGSKYPKVCSLSFNCTYIYVPTSQPTGKPTTIPTTKPSKSPSRQPSGRPSSPSSQPTRQPSRKPSVRPSTNPTNPSSQPSRQPTVQPVIHPSLQPRSHPSLKPSIQPSRQPFNLPSEQPSRWPSLQPYRKPTLQPSNQPRGKPTIQPSKQPSDKPSEQPFLKPFSNPTGQPSQYPSRQPFLKPTSIPSRQPNCFPSTSPSRQPTALPTIQPHSGPSKQPTRYPSMEPSSSPSIRPTRQPMGFPSTFPTVQPTQQPYRKPTYQPSIYPSYQPLNQPTHRPTDQPSKKPASCPSLQPFRHPSKQPSSVPSHVPSQQPSIIPTSAPSSKPSQIPSIVPTVQPTRLPTFNPSNQPSMQPVILPSKNPFCNPTSFPTKQPQLHPSTQPSILPTAYPSRYPTSQPSLQPYQRPSNQPSKQPSDTPSKNPSVQSTSIPTYNPTQQPTIQPSKKPTFGPSAQPSSNPSEEPSVIPTITPTFQPFDQPSKLPTCQPTSQPNFYPSSQPQRFPSSQPYQLPSVQPSNEPSERPSKEPTIQPFSAPSVLPSQQPLLEPSLQPSKVPSITPSTQPSIAPSLKPIVDPSVQPTNEPSVDPSRQPLSQPTGVPSLLPTRQPSLHPSIQPVDRPTFLPTSQPIDSPSNNPTDPPSTQPTANPSKKPSIQPSIAPTMFPSCQPSKRPSKQPFDLPTHQPTSAPSDEPSFYPSLKPESRPSNQPSSQPSEFPTTIPSRQPWTAPSHEPTGRPSAQPAENPTTLPSNQPTSQPNHFSPSDQPSCHPTGQPLHFPSSLPTCFPFQLPSSIPSENPSSQPQLYPSNTPTYQPNENPSVCPTIQPSKSPISSPSSQPGQIPSSEPSVQPSNQVIESPTSQPASIPSCEPSNQPISLPTKYPSCQPVSPPTSSPTSQSRNLPSAQPSTQPTTGPSKAPTRKPTEQISYQPSGQPTFNPTVTPFNFRSTFLVVNMPLTYLDNNYLNAFTFAASAAIGLQFTDVVVISPIRPNDRRKLADQYHVEVLTDFVIPWEEFPTIKYNSTILHRIVYAQITENVYNGNMTLLFQQKLVSLNVDVTNNPRIISVDNTAPTNSPTTASKKSIWTAGLITGVTVGGACLLAGLFIGILYYSKYETKKKETLKKEGVRSHELDSTEKPKREIGKDEQKDFFTLDIYPPSRDSFTFQGEKWNDVSSKLMKSFSSKSMDFGMVEKKDSTLSIIPEAYSDVANAKDRKAGSTDLDSISRYSGGNAHNSLVLKPLHTRSLSRSSMKQDNAFADLFCSYDLADGNADDLSSLESADNRLPKNETDPNLNGENALRSTLPIESDEQQKQSLLTVLALRNKRNHRVLQSTSFDKKSASASSSHSKSLSRSRSTESKCLIYEDIYPENADPNVVCDISPRNRMFKLRKEESVEQGRLLSKFALIGGSDDQGKISDEDGESSDDNSDGASFMMYNLSRSLSKSVDDLEKESNYKQQYSMQSNTASPETISRKPSDRIDGVLLERQSGDSFELKFLDPSASDCQTQSMSEDASRSRFVVPLHSDESNFETTAVVEQISSLPIRSSGKRNQLNFDSIMQENSAIVKRDSDLNSIHPQLVVPNLRSAHPAKSSYYSNMPSGESLLPSNFPRVGGEDEQIEDRRMLGKLSDDSSMKSQFIHSTNNSDGDYGVPLDGSINHRRDLVRNIDNYNSEYYDGLAHSATAPLPPEEEIERGMSTGSYNSSDTQKIQAVATSLSNSSQNISQIDTLISQCNQPIEHPNYALSSDKKTDSHIFLPLPTSPSQSDLDITRSLPSLGSKVLVKNTLGSDLAEKGENLTNNLTGNQFAEETTSPASHLSMQLESASGKANSLKRTKGRLNIPVEGENVQTFPKSETSRDESGLLAKFALIEEDIRYEDTTSCSDSANTKSSDADGDSFIMYNLSRSLSKSADAYEKESYLQRYENSSEQLPEMTTSTKRVHNSSLSVERNSKDSFEFEQSAASRIRNLPTVKNDKKEITNSAPRSSSESFEGKAEVTFPIRETASESIPNQVIGVKLISNKDSGNADSILPSNALSNAEDDGRNLLSQFALIGNENDDLSDTSKSSKSKSFNEGDFVMYNLGRSLSKSADEYEKESYLLRYQTSQDKRVASSINDKGMDFLDGVAVEHQSGDSFELHSANSCSIGEESSKSDKSISSREIGEINASEAMVAEINDQLSEKNIQRSSCNDLKEPSRAGKTAETVLISSCQPGDWKLNVASQEGFELGMRVVVAPGSEVEESGLLVAFGSLVLSSEIAFVHPAGTVVKGFSPPAVSRPQNLSGQAPSFAGTAELEKSFEKKPVSLISKISSIFSGFGSNSNPVQKSSSRDIDSSVQRFSKLETSPEADILPKMPSQGFHFEETKEEMSSQHSESSDEDVFLMHNYSLKLAQSSDALENEPRADTNFPNNVTDKVPVDAIEKLIAINSWNQDHEICSKTNFEISPLSNQLHAADTIDSTSSNSEAQAKIPNFLIPISTITEANPPIDLSLTDSNHASQPTLFGLSQAEPESKYENKSEIKQKTPDASNISASLSKFADIAEPLNFLRSYQPHPQDIQFGSTASHLPNSAPTKSFLDETDGVVRASMAQPMKNSLQSVLIGGTLPETNSKYESMPRSPIHDSGELFVHTNSNHQLPKMQRTVSFSVGQEATPSIESVSGSKALHPGEHGDKISASTQLPKSASRISSGGPVAAVESSIPRYRYLDESKIFVENETANKNLALVGITDPSSRSLETARNMNIDPTSGSSTIPSADKDPISSERSSPPSGVSIGSIGSLSPRPSLKETPLELDVNIPSPLSSKNIIAPPRTIESSAYIGSDDSIPLLTDSAQSIDNSIKNIGEAGGWLPRSNSKGLLVEMDTSLSQYEPPRRISKREVPVGSVDTLSPSIRLKDNSVSSPFSNNNSKFGISLPEVSLAYSPPLVPNIQPEGNLNTSSPLNLSPGIALPSLNLNDAPIIDRGLSHGPMGGFGAPPKSSPKSVMSEFEKYSAQDGSGGVISVHRPQTISKGIITDNDATVPHHNMFTEKSVEPLSNSNTKDLSISSDWSLRSSLPSANVEGIDVPPSYQLRELSVSPFRPSIDNALEPKPKSQSMLVEAGSTSARIQSSALSPKIGDEVRLPASLTIKETHFISANRNSSTVPPFSIGSTVENCTVTPTEVKFIDSDRSVISTNLDLDGKLNRSNVVLLPSKDIGTTYSTGKSIEAPAPRHSSLHDFADISTPPVIKHSQPAQSPDVSNNAIIPSKTEPLRKLSDPFLVKFTVENTGKSLPNDDHRKSPRPVNPPPEPVNTATDLPIGSPVIPPPESVNTATDLPLGTPHNLRRGSSDLNSLGLHLNPNSQESSKFDLLSSSPIIYENTPAANSTQSHPTSATKFSTLESPQGYPLSTDSAGSRPKFDLLPLRDLHHSRSMPKSKALANDDDTNFDVSRNEDRDYLTFISMNSADGDYSDSADLTCQSTNSQLLREGFSPGNTIAESPMASKSAKWNSNFHETSTADAVSTVPFGSALPSQNNKEHYVPRSPTVRSELWDPKATLRPVADQLNPKNRDFSPQQTLETTPLKTHSEMVLPSIEGVDQDESLEPRDRFQKTLRKFESKTNGKNPNQPHERRTLSSLLARSSSVDEIEMNRLTGTVGHVKHKSLGAPAFSALLQEVHKDMGAPELRTKSSLRGFGRVSSFGSGLEPAAPLSPGDDSSTPPTRHSRSSLDEETWEINPEAPLSIKFKEAQKKFEVLIKKNSSLTLSGDPSPGPSPTPVKRSHSFHPSSGDLSILSKASAAQISNNTPQRSGSLREEWAQRKSASRLEGTGATTVHDGSPPVDRGRISKLAREPEIVLSRASSLDVDVPSPQSTGNRRPSNQLALAMMAKYSEQRKSANLTGQSQHPNDHRSRDDAIEIETNVEKVAGNDSAVEVSPTGSQSHSPPNLRTVEASTRQKSDDSFIAYEDSLFLSSASPFLASWSASSDASSVYSLSQSPLSVGRINLSLKERAKAALNLKLLQMSHKLVSKMEDEQLTSLSSSIDQDSIAVAQTRGIRRNHGPKGHSERSNAFSESGSSGAAATARSRYSANTKSDSGSSRSQVSPQPKARNRSHRSSPPANHSPLPQRTGSSPHGQGTASHRKN